MAEAARRDCHVGSIVAQTAGVGKGQKSLQSPVYSRQLTMPGDRRKLAQDVRLGSDYPGWEERRVAGWKPALRIGRGESNGRRGKGLQSPAISG
jgi:hypothetical protein